MNRRRAALLDEARDHHRRGALDHAEALYRRVLEHQPADPDALNLLGVVAYQRGQYTRSVDLIRRAIAGRPIAPGFHTNLGSALHALGQLEAAEASFRLALDQRPDYAEAHYNLGSVLSDLGRPAEAVASFERALALRPDYADAHAHLGMAALTLGDFERGWAAYEWRWRCASFSSTRRDFSQPAWDGQPLGGQTLLVHAEQGLGDTLQFVRFLPLVAEQSGGHVVFECQPELRRLLADCPGADQVVAAGEALPQFDVHAPLMSLPYRLGTTLPTIPRDVPYVRVAAADVEVWRQRLAGCAGLKVGLVWAGNADHLADRRRSLSLEHLAPLAQLSDRVSFFSLQKGSSAAQAARPPSGLRLVDLGPDLADFADTAAALEALDLVLTVDTSVAHLAGALGRPAWALLAHVADWRWLRERTDSPWYPSLRLFRQAQPGDWGGVLARVASELGELTRAPAFVTSVGVLGEPATGQAHRPAASTYLALPVGGGIGWGVCGTQLSLELARRTTVRLITEPFDAASVGDQATFDALQALQPLPSERARLGGPAPVKLTGPVLQCITGQTFEPYWPSLRSDYTVGYSFFEENILPPSARLNALRNFDHIVTGSRWCEEVLREHGLQAVSTIIQGIDPRIFHPAAARRSFGDCFVVFSGGKLEFRKGQDLVIRAFKVLQDRHPDVLLVNAWFNTWPTSLETMGISPYIRFAPRGQTWKDRVESVLADNGIDLERTVTLPPRPQHQLADVYRDTDIGVFPNRCEGGTNLVLMEYMACGKPVIASYTSGQRDILTHTNAVLVQSMQPLHISDDDRPVAVWDDPSLDELVERLEWAYQHPGALAPLAAQAARDMAARTWSATAEGFLKLLRNG